MNTPPSNSPEEIVFHCPECTKMVAIDHRAAGMMVACPYCQAEVEVPKSSMVEPSRPASGEPAPDESPDEAGDQQGRGEVGEVEDVSGGEASELPSGALPPRRPPGQKPRGEAAGHPDHPNPVLENATGSDESMRPGTPLGDVAASQDDSIVAAIARGEIEIFKARKAGRMVVFGCPLCSRPMEIKPSQQGKEVSCKECSGRLVAPDLGAGIEAQTLSGEGGRAGEKPVHLPSRRSHLEPERAPHLPGPGETAEGEIPHRLNEGKMAKFVPRDEAEAGFDMEQAWASYPDAKPAARAWGRRLKRLSIIGMVAIMLAAVAASISWIAKANREAGAAEHTARPDGDTENSSKPRSAMRLSQAFSNANTVRDRLAFVRNPERAESRMQRFYGGSQLASVLPHLDPLSYQESELAGVRFARMEGQAVSGDPGRRVLFFEIKGDGSMQLDWESAVGYSDVRLAAFTLTPPPRPVRMRVLVRPVDYYNHEFEDPNSFVCYEITDLKRATTVYGYALRDGAVANGLAGLAGEGVAAGGSAFVSCTLDLRAVDAPERRTPAQVWIEEFIAEGWLIP